MKREELVRTLNHYGASVELSRRGKNPIFEVRFPAPGGSQSVHRIIRKDLTPARVFALIDSEAPDHALNELLANVLKSYMQSKGILDD